jgi:hypothetical protein
MRVAFLDLHHVDRVRVEGVDDVFLEDSCFIAASREHPFLRLVQRVVGDLTEGLVFPTFAAVLFGIAAFRHDLLLPAAPTGCDIECGRFHGAPNGIGRDRTIAERPIAETESSSGLSRRAREDALTDDGSPCGLRETSSS